MFAGRAAAYASPEVLGCCGALPPHGKCRPLTGGTQQCHPPGDGLAKTRGANPFRKPGANYSATIAFRRVFPAMPVSSSGEQNPKGCVSSGYRQSGHLQVGRDMHASGHTIRQLVLEPNSHSDCVLAPELVTIGSALEEVAVTQELGAL